MSESKSEKKNALLKDLESIKQLLDEESAETDLDLAEPPLLQPLDSAQLDEEEPELDLPILTETLDDDSEPPLEPPLLTAKNEEFAEEIPLLETVAEPAAKKPASSPAQASLFEDADKPAKEAPKAKAEAKAPEKKTNEAEDNDNPFLPKHIRERLHINRTLQQEIEVQMQNMINAKVEAAKPKPPTLSDEALQRVVDEIIGRHLPVIERDLRNMLLAALRRTEDSQN